ncbi:hypothetical protein D3C78_1852370 [compost metagenome]
MRDPLAVEDQRIKAGENLVLRCARQGNQNDPPGGRRRIVADLLVMLPQLLHFLSRLCFTGIAQVDLFQLRFQLRQNVLLLCFLLDPGA